MYPYRPSTPAFAAELAGDEVPSNYSQNQTPTVTPQASYDPQYTLQPPKLTQTASANRFSSNSAAITERPQWQFTVSQPGSPQDSTSGWNQRPRGGVFQSPGHRYTRSNPAEGQVQNNTITNTDNTFASSDAELQSRLQSALRLQADAFAEIARSKSNRDLHGALKASGGLAPRRSHSARVAEQIKRDEDLAKKMSMEDLAMARRAETNQAAWRRRSESRQDVSEESPLHEDGRVSGEVPPRPPSKEWPQQSWSEPSIFPEHQSVREAYEAYSSSSLGERTTPAPSYHEISEPPMSFSHDHRYEQGFNPGTPNEQSFTPAPAAGPLNDDYFSKSGKKAFDETPPQLPERPAAPVFDLPDSRPSRDSLDPRRFSGSAYNSGAISPRETRTTCDQCQREQDWVSFCPVCNFNYCQPHWDSQPLHRQKLTVNGVPHEKTNPDLAKRITSVIEPSVNDTEQNQLHVADDDTTWFGVLPDQTRELLFHDFGRYEEFLAQSRFEPKSAQFPSLISFVGPTGAGKSTIVKALVKLFISGGGHSKQQAPVVGMTQHQAVPTSGEVHLYWDPSSLLTNRPLMYADCEGLGGGSREPMAARATASRDKKTHTKEKKEKGRARSGSESYASNDSYGQHSKYISRRDVGFRHGSPSYSSMSPRNTPMPASPGNQRSSWLEYQDNTAGASHSPYTPPIEAPESQNEWTPGCSKVFRGVTRHIKWANGSQKRSRQFIVEHLYPRLLYTFSDIVVLVMRNAKQVESEIQRLIEWAATAIEKSSNQPMLPFAIIVVNAVDNRTPEKYLDPNYATQRIFDDLRETIRKNPDFIQRASSWRENNRHIDSTKDLLLAYYTDVKIVYIPEKGRPGLVWQQYKILYDEIQSAVRRSQIRRQSAHLLLSSDQFNPYLQFAFDHFSTTLDTPFDFVTASSAFNDTHPEVNHVLCLIKDYRAHFPQFQSLEIFHSVAPLVASSVMLDVVRSQLLGTPEAVFPRYVDAFKQALKTFFDEEWPCEALHPRLNERCIVVRTRHDTKGHQLATGKVWSGQYTSHATGDPEPIFLDAVFTVFRLLYKDLIDKETRLGLSGKKEKMKIAFDIHLKQVLHKQCGFLQESKLFISHRICLCCLLSPPVHNLLCGHIICDPCFTAAGRFARNHVIRLDWCPICRKNWSQGRAYVEVVQKPLNAGLRILSLDGGGVRALIQLVILKLIETRMGLGIPIQEFFDLMVGTSGGGIVALALGEKNMTVDEATFMFKDFAKEAFRPRKGTTIPFLGRLIQLRHQSKYESTGLEMVLQETFGSELLFGGPRSLQSGSRCKVAVTTTDTNREAKLLGNYNRPPRTKTPYQFQRFEKPQQELSVWEAARATSAAPGYFKGYFTPSNGHTYQDGALKLNNPILAADYERQIIWHEHGCARLLPDVLLSLGTGYFPEARIRSSESGPRYGVSLVDGVKLLAKISRDAIESDLDCEKAWDDYVQCTVTEEKRDRFHRLTLPIYGPKIELDAVDKMEELQRRTEEHYQTLDYAAAGSPSRQLDDIAAQLIASLFYFDLVSKVQLTITGMIRCRLPQDQTQHGSSQYGSLNKLARYLRKMRFSARQFRIYPSTSDSRWIPIPVDDKLLFGVEARNEIFQIQVTFDLTEHAAPSAIFLCLDKPEFARQMTSGFPRRLLSHDPSSPTPSAGSETHLARYSSNSRVVPPPTTPMKSPEFGASVLWGNSWERKGAK